ncbi:MAG: hypothetical protein KDJ38_05640 [Gammaproteobacteria bacterium]|nr:hypothetical protein [Gammaproteobacteria bacterium]
MKSVVRSLLIVVGIPTLLAALYYSFLASDIYVSETKFAIRSGKSAASISGVAALFGGAEMTGSGQDSIVVENYIHSRDMFEALEGKLSLSDAFSREEIDFVARLKDSFTQEEFLNYMIDKVDITRDETSNIISLRVKAFTAELARALALEIISLSEDLVNRLSTRMEVDAIEMAQQEVEKAAEHARDVSERLSAFRNLSTSIDPAAESSALLGIVSGIEAKLAQARTELGEKRAYMKDSSPEVQSLLNRINALKEQLNTERKRLAGDQGVTMNGLIQQYQPLILEQELARERYTSALGSLEAARIEAQRKKQYLITFVEPTLPDQAVEPRRLMDTLTVSMLAFLSFAVGGLMWSALKDHIGR